MIMALQYPIGIVLVLIGGVVWWLRWNRKWRNRVERVLLDQDEDLFDKGASYGGLVAWARYMAIPTGIVFVFPSQFALDVLIGTVTTGAFWWARLQRAKFLAFVRENKSAEVD